MPTCRVRRTATGIPYCIIFSLLLQLHSLIGSQKSMKLVFMSPFTCFLVFFCLLKRCSELLSQQCFHVSEKEQGPFYNVRGLHSVAMKIMYNFLASVSWRPGSADLEVGTMPSGQMGINVSIGYKCYRHDSQFQMLQNVVLNFYHCI